MSRLKKARLTRTNVSSQSRWSRYHLLVLAMCPPHFLGHCPDLDGVREDRVVAVPLGEVLAAHEGAVLGGPAVIVPQVEVAEVDRLRERRRRQNAVLAQAGHDVRGGLDLPVGALDGLLGLVVD